MSRDRIRKDALRAALQGIRRKRDLKAADVAAAMNMPLRSYEYFESGSGQLNLDRIRTFAQVTDSDPIAIVAAVELEQPEFAIRCADNKLGLVLFYALQDFNADLGEDISRIEAAALIQAFGATFRGLAAHVRDREAAAALWLDRRGRPPIGDPEPEGEP